MVKAQDNAELMHSKYRRSDDIKRWNVGKKKEMYTLKVYTREMYNNFYT